MKVEKIVLHKPDLEEVANVLNNGSLRYKFDYVDVDVVDCPDFTKGPYFLASEGICGNPCLAYVGGKEYLLPVVNRDKRYDFRTIAEQTNRKEVFILAAGAGPWFHILEGSTMIGDLKLGETECINTRLVTVKENRDSKTAAERIREFTGSSFDPGAGPSSIAEQTNETFTICASRTTSICHVGECSTSIAGQTNKQKVPFPGSGPTSLVYIQECSPNCDVNTPGGKFPLRSLLRALSEHLYPTGEGSTHKMEIIEIKDNTQFAIMANLYMSEGKPGKVIRVKARRGDKTPFITAIRETLNEYYKDKVVGMGGVFMINKGKIKVHVKPPEFSEIPLETEPDLKCWLKYFAPTPPLTCVSSFVSHDPGLNLMIEHTHCFNHYEGGHLDHDKLKDSEYEAYFNVAEELYRIDEPSTKHAFVEKEGCDLYQCLNKYSSFA